MLQCHLLASRIGNAYSGLISYMADVEKAVRFAREQSKSVQAGAS